MDAFTRTAVVMDAGGGVIKAGFASEDRPHISFDNMVGTPKHKRVMAGGALEGDVFVGARAVEHRGALVLHHPVEHGKVTDWDALTRVWQHAFDSAEGLAVRPEDQPMLMTEAPFTPRAQRERAAAVLFEVMRVPALHLASEPSLALYGTGRTTGVVVDVGDTLSRVVPIYEGFAVPHATSRMEYGGRDVTEQLVAHVRRAGIPFHTSAEREVLRAVKETACYVANDPVAAEAEARSGKHVAGDYKLPDGSVLHLGPERFRATEILMQPGIIGLEFPGIAESVAIGLQKCDVELRPSLMSNVLLAGGVTATKGFGERLLRDVRRAMPGDAKLRVHAPAERKIVTWIGGSILASLGTFKTMCIRKSAWDEYGTSVLYSKSAMNNLTAL